MKSLVFAFTSVLCFITATCSAAALPADIREERPSELQLPDAHSLVRLGTLVSSISSNAQRMQSVLNQENLEQAREVIHALRGDLGDLEEQMQQLLPVEYQSAIASSMGQVRYHLENLNRNLTNENFSEATKEHEELLRNWDRIDEYYQEKIAHTLTEDEETQGWLQWLFGWLIDWFKAAS